MTGRQKRKPPMIIEACGIEQYAFRPRAIKFTGRRTGDTARQARRHLYDGPTCTRCSKRWDDVQMLVEIKRKLTRCDACIAELHTMLSDVERRRRTPEKRWTR